MSLRLLRGAGGVPQHGPAVPRGAVARGRGSRADGRPSGASIPTVWSEMAEQLGLQSLIVPEAVRWPGLRLRRARSSCSRRWAGRCCALRTSRPSCSPSTPCCRRATTDAKAALLPGIASGETIATLAFTEPNGRWDESGIEATARRGRRHMEDLSGTKLLRARRPHRRRRARRGPHARRREPVLSRRRRRRAHPHAARHDGPDPQAGTPRVRRRRGHAHRHRRRRLGRPVHGARPGRRGARRRAGRRRPAMCLEMSVAVRQGARAVRPPDRLVPGHQAQVRRHAARGRVGKVRRLLRRLVRRRSATTSCPRWPRWPRPTARTPTSTRASENIQIHGGIGFTWEHPAHLYFKRAKSSELLFGDSALPPRAPRPAHRHLRDAGADQAWEDPGITSSAGSGAAGATTDERWGATAKRWRSQRESNPSDPDESS